MLFGPQSRSIFGRGSEPNPWPGGSRGSEPRAACLPAFGCISETGRPSRVLPAVPDAGQPRPCLRSWRLPSAGPKAAGALPHRPGAGESTATPFVRMLQRGLQTFPPTARHQRSHIRDPTNQSYALFTFLQRPFHFSSVKIYFSCRCNWGAYIFHSALFPVYFSKILPSAHVY